MTDLHEAAEELRKKRSDTSLMNFMQNHRVSVVYLGETRSWVARSPDSAQEGRGDSYGGGDSLRSAIIDLERSMYGGI